MKPNKLIQCLSLCLLAYLFASCSKMDSNYSEFLKKGETIYIGKADSVKSYGGKGRLKLSWLFAGDPKIVKYKIYWNNRADSIVKPFQRSPGIDSISVIIDSLNEGNYNFEIFTFDNLGNTSIKVETQGAVYGAEYQGSLLNRSLKSAIIHAGSDTASLEWDKPDTAEVGVELNYMGTDGEQHNLLVSKTDNSSKLLHYKIGTPFTYRTSFLPAVNALDTFSTAFVTSPAPQIIYPQLDKSKFSELILPGDAPTAWGWTLPLLWDNNLAEGSGFHTTDLPYPQKFSFDLGVTKSLHEMKFWQRTINLYDGGNLRKFEIWGSNDPSADGSYTGWTKLLDCESIKPSGQATGYTPSDAAYATAGESFIFPDNSPAVRYIRIKVLKTWAGLDPGSSHLVEVNFWSK